MMRFSRIAPIAVIMLCLGLYAAVATPAAAQEKKLLGRFGDWEAFIRGSGAGRVCYMVSKPQKASLRSRRGDIFFLVNHWPERKEFNVVQVDIGYPLKKRSEVEVTIGNQSWKLFTRDGNAWTYRPQDDAALVVALRKGSHMTVKGVSARGNATTDTYSLKGTSAAHDAIDKACGR